MQETKESLCDYADVSEDLANRIMNRLDSYMNYEQFCELLKTRELTYARISRALLHIVLGLKKSAYKKPGYARILAFQKEDAALLSLIKQSAEIPLVTKLSAFSDLTDLNFDCRASDLYESVITDKYKNAFQSEHTKQIVISHKTQE